MASPCVWCPGDKKKKKSSIVATDGNFNISECVSQQIRCCDTQQYIIIIQYVYMTCTWHTYVRFRRVVHIYSTPIRIILSNIIRDIGIILLSRLYRRRPDKRTRPFICRSVFPRVRERVFDYAIGNRQPVYIRARTHTHTHTLTRIYFM